MEPAFLSSRRREGIFVSLLSCGVLLSRVSSVRFAHELNIDESLMLAQAARYAHDIVPWRSVDGTTSGPISSWVLLIAHWLGMPLTYSPVHLLAAALLAGTVPLLYLAARRRFGVLPAAIGATCEATWIILSQAKDFIHYSSELVPILLISASLALGEKGKRGILAAFFLGVVPWTKLQAAPIAFVVGLWMLYRVIRPLEREQHAKSPVAQVVALVAASLIFSALLLALVFAGGASSEMWHSYFLATKYYSGSVGFWELVRRLALYCASKDDCPWVAVLLILRLCLGWRANSNAQENSNFPWLLTIASAFACVRTGMPFDHYQLLMLPALVTLTAASFVEWSGVEISVANRVRIAAVALLVFAVPRSVDAFHRFRTHLGYPSPESAEQISAAIRRADPKARSLTIWGWNLSLYIETGLPPSTRHGTFHFLILDSPSRDFLRKTFMGDLLRSGSEIFVDGGPIPLSTFPELETYVHNNFSLSQQLDTPSGPVSVYLLNSATPHTP
jgi:hypothetical protein